MEGKKYKKNNKSEKNTFPGYVDCNNSEIWVCDWYMFPDCPETCAYACNIKGLERDSSGLIKKIWEVKK